MFSERFDRVSKNALTMQEKTSKRKEEKRNDVTSKNYDVDVVHRAICGDTRSLLQTIILEL